MTFSSKFDGFYGDGFRVDLVGLEAEKGKRAKLHLQVEHQPDIPIGNNAVISGKIARKVPTMVMINPAIHKIIRLYEDRENYDKPQRGPTGYCFPFDEPCFLDHTGMIHSSQGWTSAVIDMIRLIDSDLEVGKLETSGFKVRIATFGIPEDIRAIPMFPDKHSAISDIHVEL